MWVWQLDEHDFHAGLEAAQPQEQFWGVNLAAEQQPAQKSEDMHMALVKAESKRSKEWKSMLGAIAECAWEMQTAKR